MRGIGGGEEGGGRGGALICIEIKHNVSGMSSTDSTFSGHTMIPKKLGTISGCS